MKYLDKELKMLQNEIEDASRLVKTDAYQMSIGEIVNMYKDGELIINPDFQRLFRWDVGQKSKLIESILLGIPLPSIFVFEKEDSTWELVDGLQRISTLLEFMGELKDPESGQLKEPTALVATKYLPSLNNAVWVKSENINDVSIEEQNALNNSQQLSIKRSRISVEILKRPSDNSTKFDLFQRLNSGGTLANPQELRNCIVIMVNKAYSLFIKNLANYPPFLSVLSANEDQIEKQRHLEYTCRFLVYNYVPYDGKLDIEEYIDNGIIGLAITCETQQAGQTFRETFELLNEAFGKDALRRIQNGAHTGRVGLASFECIAVGIANNIDNIKSKANPINYVKERIIDFWNDTNNEQFFTPGLRGTVRIQRTLAFATNWFST
ncbi:DUF262 domain-containing protein [Methylomonas koyamae]|uniref:DUF262 domain-containing protein n=1 Tax=Methylomonas koyamae TaxID=702114 RepID=UPI0028735B04|nr:DUF262 domain-containing protein [Methylomonas koyamae]WNB74476.1 DUF262 domain-containing protein [Methylomonas koyamae]